ncbi:hypothetical protein KKF81_02530 [Candidatus Micrarchaeota archaeon]|nr:hypothetical protein [Candidatus Micrarchaeota archaeon]MBU1165797.1 hypothetical protein [Candidatus Micrarchaeota archaeon]MBU1886287.1 hypothetical protein [Candidatus Micrarchaeota archaeon]
MKIISISIDNNTLDEFNKLQIMLDFKSRSKLLRATINSLINEYRVLEGMRGHCDVVFTITYRDHAGVCLAKIMKSFEDIIRTEIHQHHAGTCLRILVVCGDAKKVRDLFIVIKKQNEVRSVNCAVL